MVALRQQLIGKSVTIAQIFAAARALEMDYARAGYSFMRVMVPAQDINDGAALRLRVVEGFIERVDVDQLPANVRKHIAAKIAPLVGKRAVHLKEIERRLLLASDTPGVSLRSALAAGENIGGVVLVVETTHRLLTGYVAYDSGLSRSLGRNNVSLGVNLNSALGLGEALYLRLSGLPKVSGAQNWFEGRPRNRAIAGGVSLPLGHDGLLLNLEARNSRATPQQANNQPLFASEFTRYAGRLSYPFIRSRALTVLGRMSLDVQEENISIISTPNLPISLDKQRVLRPAAVANVYLPNNGRLEVEAEASFG